MTIASRLVVKATLLLSGLLIWGMMSPLHAEGICPPGMFSTNPPGAQGPISCAPIPNYAQNPGQATAPQAPQPPPERWQDHWGAIATDFSHGSVGMVNNSISQSSAEQAATADCQAKGGLKCKIEITYRNECAALVAGDKGHVTRAGASVDVAVQAGVEKCRAEDTDCKAYFTGCSIPVRVQ